MKKPKEKCPLCGKYLKYQQTYKTGYDYNAPCWCPTSIKFQGNRRKFHYVYDPDTHVHSMIVMPYRIVTSKLGTTISIHIAPNDPKATKAYKSGQWLFKTILKTPPIKPIEESKLLNKIKTILLFS